VGQQGGEGSSFLKLTRSEWYSPPPSLTLSFFFSPPISSCAIAPPSLLHPPDSPCKDAKCGAGLGASSECLALTKAYCAAGEGVSGGTTFASLNPGCYRAPSSPSTTAAPAVSPAIGPSATAAPAVGTTGAPATAYCPFLPGPNSPCNNAACKSKETTQACQQIVAGYCASEAGKAPAEFTDTGCLGMVRDTSVTTPTTTKAPNTAPAYCPFLPGPNR
jgi:hypothetical protein